MKFRFWLVILGLGLVAGLITAFRVFTTGFVLYAKTDILVWTLPIATYIFFSLTSAGLAFVSSLPMVFGVRRYEFIEKRTVFLELAVLAAGFACLILHLGSPLHTIYFLFSPNPASPLWWLAVLYGIYLVVLLASFWSIHTLRASKLFGALVFLVAIGTSTTLGWLVGMTDARPALNPMFLSAYFPVTAFACGLAATLLANLAAANFLDSSLSRRQWEALDELSKIFAVAVGAVLVLSLWRIIAGGISSTQVEFAAMKRMLGSLSFQMEFWLGMVLPLILLLIPAIRRSTLGKATACVSLLAGMLFARLELVLSGEIIPLGQMAEGQPSFVTYWPTSSELLVTVFGLSILLMIYTLGERYLGLDYALEPSLPVSEADQVPEYAIADNGLVETEEAAGVKK